MRLIFELGQSKTQFNLSGVTSTPPHSQPILRSEKSQIHPGVPTRRTSGLTGAHPLLGLPLPPPTLASYNEDRSPVYPQGGANPWRAWAQRTRHSLQIQLTSTRKLLRPPSVIQTTGGEERPASDGKGVFDETHSLNFCPAGAVSNPPQTTPKHHTILTRHRSRKLLISDPLEGEIFSDKTRRRLLMIQPEKPSPSKDPHPPGEPTRPELPLDPLPIVSLISN